MAFKMKGRPIIQGTALHKASIAKVKSESVVAQTRTQGSAELMELGLELGKSYIPAEIDYTLTSPKIDIPKKEKKEPTPKPKPKPKKKIKVESEKPNLHDDMMKSIDKKKGKDIKVVTPKKELEPGQYYTPGTISSDFDVEAANAETMRIEKERQAEVQAKIDADKVKNAAIEANKTAKQKKKEENEKKNIEIRARNQEKADAKEYFGEDVRLTQSKLDEYREIIKTEQEIGAIQEEDDPDWWETQTRKSRQTAELEKIAFKPQILSDEPKEYSAGRQRQLDKKYDASGPNVRANMLADGYIPEEQRESESVMQKRDDRIFRNAKKDSSLRSNMRKGGYIPSNER